MSVSKQAPSKATLLPKDQILNKLANNLLRKLKPREKKEILVPA